MKFGFDIDDTITLDPETFAAIINALKKDGHEIHIITYRHPLHHKDQTIKELEEYGIQYDYLHLTGQKDEICQIYGIDLAVDDRADFHYPEYMQFNLGFAWPKKKSFNKHGRFSGCFDGASETIKYDEDLNFELPKTKEELMEGVTSERDERGEVTSVTIPIDKK